MNMDQIQTTVFILILFHLTNVISGASLGSIELFNETFDVEDQHKEVIQNIQKNYGNEFRNYEMADIENFLAGFMTPVKKEKKPIYTSKTFFGSDQFFGAGERSKDNSHQQTWDPFQANRVIGSKPSYFDLSDDLSQQNLYSKKKHEPSYSKPSYGIFDLPRGIEERTEIENNSEISFTDEENESAPSKDYKSSEDQLHQTFPIVNETKDKTDELSRPVDDDTENLDDLSHPIEDYIEGVVDELSHSLDVEKEVDLAHPADNDGEEEGVELSHPADDEEEDVEFSRPADDDDDEEEDVEFSRPADDEDELSISLDNAKNNFPLRVIDYDDQVGDLSHPINDTEGQMNIFHPEDDAVDEVSELAHPVGEPQGQVSELAHPVGEPQGQVSELAHPVGEPQGQVSELAHPVGEPQGQVSELAHPVGEPQDQVSELAHPVGETPSQGEEVSWLVGTTQTWVDKLSTTDEGVFDSKDFHMHEMTTDKLFGKLPYSAKPGMDGEVHRVVDDSIENQDLHFQSANGNVSESREDLISEGDNDSEFFLLHKINVEKATEDLEFLNMSNTKNPFENPRNEVDILPLVSNGNESHFSKIPDEHLEKVQSISDHHLMEFLEKNFNKASIAKDLDIHKMDIDEFEGSGDIGDSFDVLADTLRENKSGRIIDIFPRVNNTAECKTPKGERGHCRSLSQCPLSDPLNNFNSFLQYVCLSRGILVGICCPDNPVVEISDSTENSSRSPVTEFKQPIDGCGLNTNTRIVGGKVSLPHEWTWMVALLRRNRFFCGGVIINDWYILTAAHCVMGLKVKDLTVRLGEYNFSEKNEHQEDIPVAEIKRHALFVTLTFQHDIALLKLKRRIEYTKFKGSICLPNPKSGNFSSVNATVVGWGTVAFGGTASSVLRQVTVPVWDNDECDKTYRLERITNAFMCAGSPENGEDACQGDSGGPLMTLSEEGRWEVIGIVSWGRRCGDPTFPGVYTRVTSYLDWITENAN